MTFLTPADYAARHGLRESLVRRMARDGRLPRLATREVLIPEDAATLMLAMGVPERVVQDVLGHASSATTRGYMHVVKQLGTDAAERMDRAIGGVG